ncbi:MAG: hypothetical protein QY309_01585 [Cyclobacteriaceae bacterium]|nr:MAG: hypothetical protein QY309_01585 [Cyclobacteriaceae bacterium]
MTLSKIRWIILGTLVAVISVISIVVFLQNRAQFIDLDVHGVITDVRISSNRGYPYFKIDNEWRDVGMIGYSLTSIYKIEVGDSISKSRHKKYMKIYRQNAIGKYELYYTVKDK